MNRESQQKEIRFLLDYQVELKRTGNDLSARAKARLRKLQSKGNNT